MERFRRIESFHVKEELYPDWECSGIPKALDNSANIPLAPIGPVPKPGQHLSVATLLE
jgi:hypothetical protein